MSLSWPLYLVALLPLLVLLYTLLVRRWSGARAGTLAWATALLLALTLFQAPVRLVIQAHLRSVLLSLYVLYIVWAALLFYHVIAEAGAIQDISDGVTRLTSERLTQFLILAWLFPSFLQGATGFGVPGAVVTPLLIGLGFDPLLSVTAAGIAHSWAVTFGSLGSSFYTMAAVTGLPEALLAPDSALLLGAMAWGCGAVAAYQYGRGAALRRGFLLVAVAGAVMAVVQYLMALAGYWSIASFAAGLAGLAVAVPLARLPIYRGETGGRAPGAAPLRRRLLLSLSAYGLLIAVILLAELPILADLLNRIRINLTFVGQVTGLGWQVAGGPGRSVSLFGHAGALILYASLLSYLTYRMAGRYRDGAARRIWARTVRGAKSPSIGIITLGAMALVMDNSGMVYAIADGMRQLMPAALYPMVAPWIGALGSFMTGSNTNSNVLFAPLQQQVAQLLGLSVPALLAGQTTGGALGSMIAPAKILVGASTADLAGREGEILRMTWPYAVLLFLITGLLTYLLL